MAYELNTPHNVTPYAPPSPARADTRLRRILILAGMFLFLGIVGFVVADYMFFTHRVDGDAMLPTLKSGDTVVISRLFGSPQRGDIVVFPAWNESKDYLKRIIAVGGDTIEIKADFDPVGDPKRNCECGVYVNGVKLNESYVLQTPDYDVALITVPPAYVYVLGDNRRNSSDSHVRGPLEVSSIRGKVLFK